MSSKKSKDKFDQIIIETTQLKVNVKTTGDLITKEYDLIPFHPNMSDLRDLSNNSYILFPSFVKITMKDLKKAGVGEDYPKVFLNLEKYIKLIKYVTSPEREVDYTLFIDKTQVTNYATALVQNSLTDLLSDEASDIISIQKYEALTEEDIITNNIELIKRLFFPLKGHFFILGNDYVIGKSKYIPKYEASSETNTKLDTETRKIPLAYTVRFEVQLLDAANNPDAGDFLRMSCKGKKNSIAADTMDIFGTNFGYVPEKKAPIQSILNTSEATKSRQYGKLQKEWEERNKYVKAPANERERLEQESKWTPLQKKMAQYDKYQEVYNKIPPMWIKERKEFITKFANFKKEIGKLKEDIENIEKSNPTKDSVQQDMIDGVIDKMKTAIGQLGINTKKEPMPDKVKNDYADKLSDIENHFKELLDYQTQYKDLKKKIESEKDAETKKKYEEEKSSLAEQMYNLKDVNDLLNNMANISKANFYTDAYDADEKIINDKYVKPLLEAANIDGKKKDIVALKKQEDELRKRMNPADPYGNKSVQVDMAKLQGELRKKEAEINMLENKFGIDTEREIKTRERIIDGSKLIKTWVDSQTQLEKLADTIEKDKSIEEKKIKAESVNKELDEKLKEIVKLKKDLILAKFFAGDYFDLTKSEKESNEKKSMKDKPLEDVDTLKTNLENTVMQYLETAKKFSPYNEVQAYITLLNNDLNEVKKVKESWKKEKDTKDGEISKKLADIANVKKGAEGIKTDDIKGLAELDEKLRPINEAVDAIRKEINKTINPVYDNAVKKYDLYTKYTSEFKKLGQKDTDLLTKYDNFKKKFEAEKETIEKESAAKMEAAQAAASAPATVGGKYMKRTRKRRQQKKPSKRYILSKNKIKKTKSSRYRKKKYTLRRWRKS